VKDRYSRGKKNAGHGIVFADKHVEDTNMFAKIIKWKKSFRG
jgi:hypothetical protein